MNRIFILTLFGNIGLATSLLGQSVYMPNYYNSQHILDRMETLSGSFSDELHLTSGPLSQYRIGKFLFQQKSNVYNSNLSNTDNYQLNKMLYAQPEWLRELGGTPIERRLNNRLAPFYNNPVNLFEYHNKDIYLSINPKIGLQYMQEQSSDWSQKLSYTGGIELKSVIAKRVGLFLDYTANSYNPSNNIIANERVYHNLPGVGKYTTQNATSSDGPNFQYHQFRGHLDVSLLKNYVNLTAGYGQHRIGDGYRSLMLSDFAEASWFVKLNTQIWKVKYQNLYSVYQPQTIYKGYEGDTKEFKYATTHHLSINMFKWLNVGLFETVMFGRSDRYEFGYVNPLIFYRSVERSMGSPDKIIIGANAKAIPTRGINMYGQFILNEFSASEFFGSNKYWGNKWGAQLGLKYYDAFSISNFDIQLEGNVVRPYTYSANVKMGGQILTNYSHFNQTLAHPLGAGFREFVMNVGYSPAKQWRIDGRLMYYQQTLDAASDTISTGNNILKNYDLRDANVGVKMINGVSKNVVLGNINISYEPWMNTYFELGATYRCEELNQVGNKTNHLNIYAGFRMNLNRRDIAVF